MSRRRPGKAVVQFIQWSNGLTGYQARAVGWCKPGTTKYFASLKHGTRRARVLAYTALGQMLHEARARARKRRKALLAA